MTGAETGDGRRARTGRDAPLTRDEITATALRAAERGELDAMTMRSLADELGVTAMALYSHVASKDEILDEIIDAVLAHEAMPPPVDGADWKAWTLTAAERLQGVLVRYPALLDRYCRRPVGVPAALRRMEASLEVLRGAGFDADECVAAYATVHTYTLGFAALEIARQVSSRVDTRTSVGTLTEASPHYWPAFFASLDGSEFPNLTRLTPDLTTFTTERQFHDGLLAVLAGIDARRSSRGAVPMATSSARPELVEGARCRRQRARLGEWIYHGHVGRAEPGDVVARDREGCAIDGNHRVHSPSERLDSTPTWWGSASCEGVAIELNRTPANCRGL